MADVCPFTLGIETSKQMGRDFRDGYLLPTIERNTTIPVSRVERVGTIHANQTVITVLVYQGESRRVEDNMLLAEFDLAGIPRGPAGQSADVRFTYDRNGVLEVETSIVETEKTVTHLVTRNARGMTPKQIEHSLLAMKKLKTHPREESTNRFMLQRAERLYAELSQERRVLLDQLLDGFATALESQDQDSIGRHRATLQQFLEAHDFDDPNNRGAVVDD